MEPNDSATELREDYLLISSWLIYYNERKRSIDIMRISAQDKRWEEVFELLHHMLGPKKRLLLELRRLEAEQPVAHRTRGRPGWVVWVQHHWVEAYAKRYGDTDGECWVSDGMAKNMWSEIVGRCTMLAAKKGLLG